MAVKKKKEASTGGPLTIPPMVTERDLRHKQVLTSLRQANFNKLNWPIQKKEKEMLTSWLNRLMSQASEAS